jgi:hypothetical protein
MPDITATIDRDQRDGLYELIRNHLGAIGDVWIALAADPCEGRGPDGDPVTLLRIEFPVPDPDHPQSLWARAGCDVEAPGKLGEEAKGLRGGAQVLVAGPLSERWAIERGHSHRCAVILAFLIEAGPAPGEVIDLFDAGGPS